MDKYRVYRDIESKNEGNDTPYLKLAELIDQNQDLGSIFEVECLEADLDLKTTIRGNPVIIPKGMFDAMIGGLEAYLDGQIDARGEFDPLDGDEVDALVYALRDELNDRMGNDNA